MATTTSKTAAAKAGTKPDFLVVESSLKCQTANGELSLPLSIKFGTIRKLMKLEGDQIDQFDFFMEHVFDQDINDALDDLDGTKSLEILTTYATELADRMKASLGESKGSSESSTDTEQP